ncbi:MAG: N-acetylmuramoyl-L-alanine amidase [Bryobacteraceae bacterium]|nr:N-acetylmuramoyl-L-alanine amidase [Bryobacteraceae bacterium]
MTPRLRFAYCLVFLLTAASAPAQPLPSQSSANTLSAIRFWTFPDTTRVVIETSSEFEFRSDRVPNPDRIFFDLPDTSVRLEKKRHALIPVNDPRLKQIRVAETQPGLSRIVFDVEDSIAFTASRLTNPPRLVVELRKGSVSVPEPSREFSPPPSAARLPATGKQEPVLADAPPVLPKSTLPPVAAVAVPVTTQKARVTLPPPPKAARVDSSQSMTRVLGLKVGRIVLDPGHGGHDTGTIGPNGLYEKDLVLDVCRRLGALIETRLGAEVVYTRLDDTFIPLERRTEMANHEKADLFLSIHANSSPVAVTSGVETYYLNFTDSKAALELAARENAGSARTVYDLKDLVQQIALHDKIEESRQFAARIQQALFTASARVNLKTRDRGVRKAPFVVLIGAAMPSVLAEIGFVTNPKDEALFRKPEFRQKIAEGLYQGVSRYAGTLSQFQVAQN